MPLRDLCLLFALVIFGFFPQQVIAQESPQAGPVKSLRVAVAPMMSPQDTFSLYFQLLDYLGSQLGVKIDLVQRKTHAEVGALLRSGKIDMAFICSGPYALANADSGQHLLAMPVVQGALTYQTYIIVHSSNPVQSFADLRGGTFAFTDPESNTGYLNVLHLLRQMDSVPASFFKNTIFTHSHDNSILAVSRGIVDAAAVNSLVWDYYSARRPSVTAKTRILAKSGNFAMPPVVTSSNVDAAQQEAIRKVLLHLHESQAGQKLLNALRIDKFIVPDDAWYSSVKDIAKCLPSEAIHE